MLILPVHPPKVTHSDTVFMGWRQSSRRAPHLALGLLLWRFVSGDLSLCCQCVWLSAESQGAWRVQEVLGRRPRGFSCSLRHLSKGFKGPSRIFLCGVGLHRQNTDVPAAQNKVQQIIVVSMSHT